MNNENPRSSSPQESSNPEEKKLEESMKEPTIEEQKLSEEDEERYEQWMEDHPEIVIAPEDLRECGPEIAELEKMLTSFELTYSLAELHLIIDLRPEDVANYPLRESAKAALTPIVTQLNALKRETNITQEKYDEIRAKYQHLSRAVGMINRNKVDHTR